MADKRYPDSMLVLQNGLSDDELICEVAYALAVAAEDSSRGEMRSLIMTDENIALSKTVPELCPEFLAPFRVRTVFDDNRLGEIARVLKLGTKRSAARASILKAFVKYIAVDYMLPQVPGAEKQSKLYGEPLALIMNPQQSVSVRASGDVQDAVEVKVVPDALKKREAAIRERLGYWGCMLEYIYRFLPCDEFESFLMECYYDLQSEVNKKRNGGKNELYDDEEIEASIKASAARDGEFLKECIYSERKGVCWFRAIDGADKRKDNVKIDSFASKDPFYSVCMKQFQTTVSEMGLAMTDRNIFSIAAREGLFSPYHMLVKKADRSSLIKAESKVKDDVASFKVYAQESFNKLAHEYADAGIDLTLLCLDAAFTKKELVSFVKQAFCEMELLENAPAGPMGVKERHNVVYRMFRDMCQAALKKRLLKLQTVPHAAAGDTSEPVMTDGNIEALHQAVAKLQDENDRLHKEVRDLKDAAKKKDPSDSGRQYKDMINELKEEIASKDAAYKELEEDYREFCEIMSVNYDEEEAMPEEAVAELNKVFPEEEFREFINSNRVLCWGLRDNIKRRCMELYPEMTYFDSDHFITRQQIESYDFVLIATGFTDHGQYYAVKDVVKASNRQFAILPKQYNSVTRVRQVIYQSLSH